MSVLHSSVEFLKELPELEQRSIIWHSTFSVVRAGKITKDTLTPQINKWERACALRPTRKFVLTTSLSARYFPLLTRTEVARHRITFGNRLPKRSMKNTKRLGNVCWISSWRTSPMVAPDAEVFNSPSLGASTIGCRGSVVCA